MTCFVYLLECIDHTLYCGWTNDLQKRLKNHNAGTASKYTRNRRPVKLAYFEEHPTSTSCKKREYAIKQLSRTQKLELIKRFKTHL